jgi:RNA polymerase sigma-70 factor (ECF subfamily)
MAVQMPELPERESVIEFPAGPGPAEVALEELELVYAYIYARVGNRPDTEDLTQQVALKAIPRLREGASAASIRAYLFTTARTVLASFWSVKFGMPEDELREDLAPDVEAAEPSTEAVERVDRILAALPPNYRRVLELRFLRGYSLREVAAEVGSTVGGVKVMQLRALRAAARVGEDA